MKVPKRIGDLLTKKEEYLRTHRNRLEKSVLKLQGGLLDKIIAEVVPSLDMKDGIIQDTEHNYRVISELDKVYKQFTDMSSKMISAQFAGVTDGIVRMSEKYMRAVIPDNITPKFDKVIKATAKKINLRVGLDGGEMFRGGFLETFLKDQTLGMQVKNYIAKSVTGQIDSKEFITGLQKLIKGDEGPGALEKQYQRYAYDLYQQYDRAYNSSLADEFDMKYFIYQGGLIDESRDFCVAHNNKVWSREEAAEWVSWTPAKGEYPAGYKIKQKDPYAHPSYMDYPGYTPLVDAGGYNCRHSIGWISDELAFELRPDLKE